jgi:hypothetical protein
MKNDVFCSFETAPDAKSILIDEADRGDADVRKRKICSTLAGILVRTHGKCGQAAFDVDIEHAFSYN